MLLYQLIKENRDVGLLDDPQFDRASRFDWRRYVPERVRLVWKEMSVEARVVAKVFAQKLAEDALCREAERG